MKKKALYFLNRLFYILLTSSALIISLKCLATNDLESIKKRGEIRLALESMFTGENLLSWRNGGNGEYHGMEIDLAKIIASEIGVKLIFVPTKWDRIHEAVTSGRADIGLQQLFIPKKVPSTDLWSAPYLQVGLALVTKKSAVIPSIESFKHHTVAMLNDPTAMEYVSRLGIKNPRIFDSESRMLACVLNESCKLAISDRPLLLAHVKNHNNILKISSDDLPGSGGQYGVLLRANQHRLKKAVDSAIDKWKKAPTTALQIEQYGLKNAMVP